MKKKHYIDSHKAVTFLAVLGMIAYHQQWQNATAWVYLGMHGTYGILWVIKSRVFPDRHWEERCSPWYGLYILAGLSLYWIAPWLITSGGLQAPAWLLGSGVSAFTLGVFLHFSADMQKYTALKYRPAHLITDGLLQGTRNINYFGEFLIYISYSLLSMHWLPFAVNALYLAVIWFPNMFRKEKSLARYAEFEEYRRRTRLFIPFLF